LEWRSLLWSPPQRLSHDRRGPNGTPVGAIRSNAPRGWWACRMPLESA